MTDPTDSLLGFQKALDDSELSLRRGELDNDLSVHFDQPHGTTRLTYVRIDQGTVTALAVFVGTEPLEGLPCFQVGIAVPESHRRRGLAKAIVEAAMAEMKNGLARNNIARFYIEAIVGTDNVASQRVSAATLSKTPTAITDEFSGLPALQYLRKVG